MIQNITVSYNGYNLVNAPDSFNWAVNQVDGGQQQPRGENIPVTGRNGRLYVKKCKDQAKVMVYMEANTEASLTKLKQEVFQEGLHDFTCSPSAITAQQAEAYMTYSIVANDKAKIVVEFTVPLFV